MPLAGAVLAGPPCPAPPCPALPCPATLRCQQSSGRDQLCTHPFTHPAAPYSLPQEEALEDAKNATYRGVLYAYCPLHIGMLVGMCHLLRYVCMCCVGLLIACCLGC